MHKTAAILLAAGKSERYGGEIPKPFLSLNGKKVYQYSLQVLFDHSKIDKIILVVPEYLLETEKGKHKNEKLLIISGGNSRFESVQKAMAHCDDSIQNVIVHDAARPFIRAEFIDSCFEKLNQNKAVSYAIESTDTLVFETDKIADSFPDRNKIKQIQTPQAFHFSTLKKAYELALKEGKTDFTDDCSLIHHYKLASIILISGSEQNIKITYPSDLLLAELILQKLIS